MPNRVRRLVEASARIEPGIVDSFRHGLAPLREFVADAFHPVRRGISSGRHARHGLEHTVEVVGAEARPLCQCRETRRLLLGFDHAADIRNLCRMELLERRLIRLAALTRPEFRTLRVGRGAMKAHVLRVRPT
jgi:hypothetical protein